MAATKKKYFWNIVLIVAVTAVAMYFALKDNFKDIVETIAKMNFFSLLIVLAWGLAINGVIGIGYTILARHYKKNYSIQEGIIVAFVGTFFAGITPSSTGGQIGQAYVLKKQGINYSDGASLLWADFIIYQTTMMLYVTVLFFARFSHYVNLNSWIWIVGAGYLVNMAVIIALYTVAIFPNFYIKLCEKFFHFLGRLHLFRGFEQKAETWVKRVAGFTKETKALSQNKRLILSLVLVNLVRLTLYFSLPFVVAVALGIHLHPSQYFDTLALASFVVMANSFVPLPGAAGGTEVFFTMLFQQMLGKLTGAVLLLWRFSSYYIPMIVGAIIFTLFKNHEDALEAKALQATQIDSTKKQKPESVALTTTVGSTTIPTHTPSQKNAEPIKSTISKSDAEKKDLKDKS